jgi:hypothetical protein
MTGLEGKCSRSNRSRFGMLAHMRRSCPISGTPIDREAASTRARRIAFAGTFLAALELRCRGG